MTKDQMLVLLREQCDEAGGQGAWAASVGVSASYVSDVLAGRKEPGEAVVAALNLERVVSYRRRGGGPFVYLAATARGPNKIGYSLSPDVRMASISRRFGKATLFRQWEHQHARTLEAHILRAFADRVVVGEWIDAPVTEIVHVVDDLLVQLDAGLIEPSIAVLRRMGSGPEPLSPQESGRRGAVASIAANDARIQTAIKDIRDDWLSGVLSATSLLKRAGISYSTAVKYIGRRPERAQRLYQATAKRRLSMEKRRSVADAEQS